MSEIKVNSIKGVGATDAAITVNNSDGTCTANLTSIGGNQLSNRRVNINGAMTVSQRGTVTGITNNASAYGGPDRYKTTVVNHGTYTTSQESDAPDGFVNSLKINTTSAASSPASNARLYLQHKIEKTDLIQLKKGTSGALQITVQFFVKSDKTGTYILEIFDNVNNRHVSATYAISSANTWEKKTITFPADTGGNAITAGNSTGLEFNWWIAAGSYYTSGTLATTWTGNSDPQRVAGITVNVGDSGYWQITGVQIEVGSVATDFEHRTFAQELQLCKRYFNNFGATTATGGSATYMLIQGGYARFGGANSIALQRIFYDVEMRTTPTIKYGRNTDNDDFAVMRWSSDGSNPIVYLGSTEGSNRCGFQITRYNAGSGSNPVTETYNDGDSFTHSISKFRADAEL